MVTRGLSALVATLLALGLGAGSAIAGTGEERGAEILGSVQSGERDCDQLETADFEAVGELVMGRMLGTPEAHEAMDRMMASMMGDGNLDRMHETMGERFTDCGDSRAPGGFAGMMGMMGMMGGGSGPGGMMGGGEDGFGPAGMMGVDGDGDEDDVGAWMAVAMLLLVAVAVGAVIFVARQGRRSEGPGPLDLLALRFARGEIGAEEYAERRRLLEDGTR